MLIVTLFLTQSRGGFVGLAAMIVTALVFSGSVRPRVVALVLVLGASAIAYFGAIAPPSAKNRVTDYSAASSTGRVDLWGVALEIVGNHPLVGVGTDNFTTVAPRYLAGDRQITRPDFFLQTPEPVHNTYLEILTDLGGVGLLLFVAFLAAVAATAVGSVQRLARAGDREGELLGRALVIGTVGMLTAFVFFSAQYQRQLWLILGALVGLSSMARAAGRLPRRPRSGFHGLAGHADAVTGTSATRRELVHPRLAVDVRRIGSDVLGVRHARSLHQRSLPDAVVGHHVA